MTRTRHTHERGAISGVQVTIGGLAVLVLGLGSFAIWAFVNYQDAQSNVDSKIQVAVAEAQKEQSDSDEKKYQEYEKNPSKTFKGPDDYCGLTFSYPKTWSAYEANDATDGGTYEAYLSPDKVLPVSDDQQYALRVTIEQKDYDDVINKYANLVTKGDLKQSTASSQGNQGTRFDGSFSDDIRGAAVIYKCRNYTITLRTDADTFLTDFNTLVQTADYNS